MSSGNRVVRVAYLFIGPEETFIQLVLQRGGKEIPQTDGGIYVQPRVWKPSGGQVKPGEGLKVAAKREYGEETGQRLPDGHLKRKWHRPDKERLSRRDGQKYTIHYFIAVGSLTQSTPPPISFCSEEIEAVKWFPMSRLSKIEGTKETLGAFFDAENLSLTANILLKYREPLEKLGVKPEFIDGVVELARFALRREARARRAALAQQSAQA